LSEALLESPDRGDVTAVADNFVTLMRTFTRVRSRWMAAAAQDVERAGHIVLRFVATHEGPVRATAIAEGLQSDPSTVSRQVAALVKDGLLERRADQEDGRASLLVVTDKAHGVLAEHDEIRISHFADMLDGWAAADLRRFAAMLAQFTADFEQASDKSINSEKAATRDRSAGRNA
jgi:DNA-binding MarR family transcriptional regulator